ncbi:hypothetical protein CAPTEDRAFT_140761, partial [Capitella teleta]
SDIRFVIGPNRKTIYAHRCILAARCEVFKVMFSEQAASKDNHADVPFVMSDTTAEVFLPLLEYIYTNCVTLTQKNCIEVLGSSMEYGLEGLRQACINWLIARISDATACEILQAGVTYNQDQLKDAAVQYIASNTAKVFQSKGFNELSDTALSYILKCNKLMMDEMEIVKHVTDWSTVNSVVLNKPVAQIAKRVNGLIRLPLLSPQELRNVEENNDNKLLAVDSFAYAWKCHALQSWDQHNPLTTLRTGTLPRDFYKAMKSST